MRSRFGSLPRLSLPLLGCLALFSLAALRPSTGAAAEDAPIVPPKNGPREVIELFNGRDLTGWKGDRQYWSVQDGIIVGRNSAPIAVSTYLLTERSYSDFRLLCDFKLARSEMHSGIALWGRLAPEQGDPWTYAGHLVMFPSGYGFYDLYGRKGIHKNADVAKQVGKQHDWNHLEILAQGNRIRLVINGVLVSDWREPEPERIKAAPLGLQLHSNKVPQEVQFKNLTLETFPEDKLLSLVTPANPLSQLDHLRLYVGTYTGEKSQGIYRVDLDLKQGKFASPVLAAETKNPSFLALHPNASWLYAVNEVGDYGGEKSGSVSAFAIEPGSGDLKLLNQQSSRGAAPCHLTIDAAGQHVLAANYGGGSVCVLPIASDGKLGPATSFMQHTGKSVHPKRQDAPHAHSINLDPWNRFALVADLGLDRIIAYRFDGPSGTLATSGLPVGVVQPGAGPRHLSFHPSGKFAYVINEMGSTITVFAYDRHQASLVELQTISTLPEGYRGPNSTAEVVCHPSGQFLYGSNRGHHSLAAYRIDQASGKLSLVGIQGEGIRVPRNFHVEPTGRYAVVANQAADNLTLFRIEPATGALQPTGETVELGSPVCVKFLFP
jgi:6-phosphogluconolactonase